MKLKSFFSLPLAALIAAGCATTGSNDEVAMETQEPVVVVEEIQQQDEVVVPVPPPIPPVLNSVEFITDDLVDRLVVTETHYERTPGQALKVTCTMRNMTNEDMRLQARTQYFSEDRAHEEGPGAWQLVFVPANGMETYTSFSYGRNLSTYYVEVQEL